MRGVGLQRPDVVPPHAGVRVAVLLPELRRRSSHRGRATPASIAHRIASTGTVLRRRDQPDLGGVAAGSVAGLVDARVARPARLAAISSRIARHRTRVAGADMEGGRGGSRSAKRRGKGASSLGTSPPPIRAGPRGVMSVPLSSSGSPGCPGPPRRRTRPTAGSARSSREDVGLVVVQQDGGHGSSSRSRRGRAPRAAATAGSRTGWSGRQAPPCRSPRPRP